MTFQADPHRYDGRMPYRRCGRSGLDLPILSLGLWQNFGASDVFETGRAMIRRAFDRGVTHFDLANNYGTPYGSAEDNFGRWMTSDLAPHRDELIISSKAGWDMWPGPYGGPSGSRKYVIASCEQSLRRTTLDYFDIFYSHRMDETTPLEETAGALVQLHRQGKALYVGISAYTVEATIRMVELLASEGVPMLVHQPRYSLLHRDVEGGLLAELARVGAGCVVFSPLEQGLLSDRFLDGLPPSDSRLAKGITITADRLTPATIERLRALSAIAAKRGQSLAQMAIAWTLRDTRVTSAIIGTRTVRQLDELLDAANGPSFDEGELREIDLVTRAPANDPPDRRN